MKNVQTNRQCLAIPSGGDSAPSNPASFADAKALFLGNGNLTYVDGLLDEWENEGTDGGNASATNVTNTIPPAVNLGEHEFQDFQPWGHDDFKATGFNTGSITEFSFELVTSVLNSWNPGRIGPSVGDINNNDYPCLVWVGSQGVRVSMKSGGTTYNCYWSKANCGFEYGEPISITVLYDGTGATTTDKLKLYVNRSLITMSTVPGSLPSSLSNGAGEVYITSPHSTYSTFQTIGGYVAYWERLLTSDERSANEAWRSQIWNV